MKEKKSFNVNDKVFAKIKGYPPWPAKIVAVEGKNKKYHVKYYGTGETGVVKGENITYYLKNKDSILKPNKRKDYNEAIEEIEAEIKIDGTDGSDANANDESDAPNWSIGSDTTKKGKQSKTSLEGETVAKKRRLSNTSSVQESGESDADNKSSLDVSTESSKKPAAKKIGGRRQSKRSINESQKSQESEDVEMAEESDAKVAAKKVTEEEKIECDIISLDHLKGIIAYAEHVRNNKSLYSEKPVDDRPILKKSVVVAKLPSGKLVGIKYNIQKSPDHKTEYEMAQYEEAEVKKILSLKEDLQSGSKQPEDVSDLIEPELGFDEVEIQQILMNERMKKKKAKLELLKVESNLISLGVKIKACLALDKARPKEALTYLDSMLKLDIEPLMLKKHPEAVEMVRRLRRYVGNVKEWKLSDDALETFQSDAEKIRNKADDVYMKFKKLFTIPVKSNFWDAFNDLVNDFLRQTKGLKETQVFSLSFEPNSQQAFLDQYEEQQLDLKSTGLAEDKSAESKAEEKENLSQAANSETADKGVISSNAEQPVPNIDNAVLVT